MTTDNLVVVFSELTFTKSLVLAAMLMHTIQQSEGNNNSNAWKYMRGFSAPLASQAR